MGVLDVFKRAAAPVSRRLGRQRIAKADLFDEEFQKKLETLAIVSRRVFAGRQRAERRTKKKGSGIEFADHRDYVAGDDFRYVDWNVYQRFGRLLVRLYEEEEDLSVYFIVDCSTSMGFADGKKFDQARRLCAALAYVALANLDRVTIVSATDSIVARMPTTRGKGRIFKVFQFLRGIEPNGVTDLSDSLKTFVAQHKRRGLAVLISDLYDPAGFEHGINVLRYNKFEPYVIHLIDPSEARPDLKGDVRIYDCETGEEREVTVTQKLLERMERAWNEYLVDVERFCTTRQVPYFKADVNTPFDELVLSVFRRGGFLR
ncbi:MAG TPA: DUF58 domain-containing protein [Polyangiaceae bacterium]|nr:DUF58 domain-containing protein [Polyangiaceae bacterium]HMR77609.1 DUF58 domain-containing protein [Polyangiaceae bacterium]